MKISIEDTEDRVIRDIISIENSNMFVNEKRYYINLIDILYKLKYYEDRQTFKDLWSKK